MYMCMYISISIYVYIYIYLSIYLSVDRSIDVYIHTFRAMECESVPVRHTHTHLPRFAFYERRAEAMCRISLSPAARHSCASLRHSRRAVAPRVPRRGDTTRALASPHCSR